MHNPLVSVVMPAYNAASTLTESIESVLKQSYQNWELIIVDDGSIDTTAKIANKYQHMDPRVNLFSKSKNAGLSAARNTGIEICNGQFIAFLDSDDIWSPTKLERQVKFHDLNKGVSISHTGFNAFDVQSKNKLPLRNLLMPEKAKKGLLYPQLCYQNTIGVLTVMVKKDVLNKVGSFDTTLKTLEDQDLWIRIAKENYVFGYIPDVLAHYRMTASGLTGQVGKYKRAYKKFIEKIQRYDNLNQSKIWRAYFRYFGAVYFKNNQYKLSKMYLRKSIRIARLDFFSATSILYLLYVTGISILLKIKDQRKK